MRFEVFQNKSGWHWHLKDATGETIASGKTYATKGDALESLKVIRSDATRTAVITIHH